MRHPRSSSNVRALRVPHRWARRRVRGPDVLLRELRIERRRRRRARPRRLIRIRGSESRGGGRMATEKQRRAARKNVKKAQSGARKKRTITKLSKGTRRSLG